LPSFGELWLLTFTTTTKQEKEGIKMSDTIKQAIKRYLKGSVSDHPDPTEWWCFIINQNKGNFGPLLEGYRGDILKIHAQIKAEGK
jgi:hypothetical protein